ncbi:MAG: DUF1549 and DUF1553 domain-containing protein [Fuerstiella sp.]|nr:DUF1549 and DUF1553 domain-containing protein [Fuerstiella sp.]
MLCIRVAGLSVILITVSVAAGGEDVGGYTEPPITEDDRQHWSFNALQSVKVPDTRFTEWRRHTIDYFIAAELEQHGLEPQPAASRQTLIRRLSFDLIGLPPTPAEIDSFVSDDSPDAYDRLIARLLTSKGHGERWAQHWLDLARFAETDGFEHDKLRKDAWMYRDWVIDALNADMPYDEFLRRQIAGDELYPDDDSARIATRFCLSGPDMPDINLQEERRHTLLNELTSTVGEVVLGLQIGCARCHDHKYDPISQADFYRLRAVFEPAVHLQKNRSVTGLSEKPPYTAASHIMLRGDFRRPGAVVTAGVLRVINSLEQAFSPVGDEHTAGRRTALAAWLTSRHNPLTARVIVNRVWQHHFGTGIVDTPSEFGIMGSEPSHDSLLDWLSNWFVENGWSLKKLHHLIVTSATYRQRSFLADDATDIDGQRWRTALNTDTDARLLSRYPRWRLEGEAVRDAMLFSAGVLNRRSGGPGVRPPLPKELLTTLLKNQWKVTEDKPEHDRRSVYVFARRNLRYPIFEVFDRPSANASCPDRGVSTTAPQSLHLLNSEFSAATARRLVESLAASPADQQIQQMFHRVLGRQVSVDEMRDALGFLAESNESTDDRLDGLTHLCLSLFNCNEFIFVD